MILEESWFSEFYKDLRALEENTFPKNCPLCKKVYLSLDDFVLHTNNVMSSRGLIEATRVEDEAMVALFRNCSCGSTLMVECKDRRDISKRGVTARMAFGNLMAMLKKAGVSTDVARQELLTVVRGGESETLKKIGISFDKLK